MTVLQVTRMWSKQGVSSETSDGRVFTLTQTEGYQVTTTPDATGGEVLTHPDVPKSGQVVSGFPTVMVRSVKPSRVSPILWVVDVTASGEVGENPTQNPLLQRAVIRRRALMSEEPIDQDYFGQPIATINNAITVRTPHCEAIQSAPPPNSARAPSMPACIKPLSDPRCSAGTPKIATVSITASCVAAHTA